MFKTRDKFDLRQKKKMFGLQGVSILAYFLIILIPGNYPDFGFGNENLVRHGPSNSGFAKLCSIWNQD